MKLKEYLEAKDISPVAFAKKVNLSRQSIYGYMDDKLPTIPTAIRIEKVTDGDVGLYDWAEDLKDKPPRRPRKRKTLDNFDSLI